MNIKHGDLTVIAKKAGCTIGALSSITLGRRRPSPSLAIRLEKATGIPRVAWIWPKDYKNPMLRKSKKDKG